MSIPDCARCSELPEETLVSVIRWTGPAPALCRECRTYYHFALTAMKEHAVPDERRRMFIRRRHWMKDGKYIRSWGSYYLEGLGLEVDPATIDLSNPTTVGYPISWGYAEDKKTIVNTVQLWQYRVYVTETAFIEAHWQPDMDGAGVALCNLPMGLTPSAQEAFSAKLWRAADLMQRTIRGAKPGQKRLEDDPDSGFWETIEALHEYRRKNPKHTNEHAAFHLGITKAQLEKYIKRANKIERERRQGRKRA